MFDEAARKKARSPAARKKAVATLKKTLARKRREKKASALGTGKTTVFNLSDVSGERPPQSTKKKYAPRSTSPTPDRVQLLRELIALITQVLK